MISNNLSYTDDSDHRTVKWCVNLDALIDNIDSIVGFPSTQTKYAGPTFFLNGSLSVQYDDQVYLKEFPNSKIHRIEGAGHYVYIDKS